MEKPKDDVKILSTLPIVSWLVGLSIGFAWGIMLTHSQHSETFLKVILVGGMGSFLSFFLQFTYQPGHIFGFWIPWVEKNFRDNPKNPIGFLANPLGICAFCQNIWLTTFIFVFAWWKLDLSMWWFIPSTLVSHMILTLLAKLFWED